MTTNAHESRRRWRLVLGEDDPDDPVHLDARDRRLDGALSALYGQSKKGRGGLGRSSPRVAKWLGDIREFFPTPVVRVVQRDAMERLGLRQLLLEPELMSAVEADVHLVADLVSLRAAMPEATKETARVVVRRVVDEILERLQHKTAEAVRGALDRSRRTRRPRIRDVDWGRTIEKNLRHWIPARKAIIPETLVGHARHSKRLADLDEVVMCVDQSGSMATSVVYASIFAAVLASLPSLATKLICFDTQVLDLTEDLQDPVDVLFGVQLGGGTDIAGALSYVAERIERPSKTHLVLITDLYEGGNEDALLRRARNIVTSGVQLIVLLALSDDGKPSYDANVASRFAELGCPVFGCTPDQFPDLIATALRRGDVSAWAAAEGIAAERGGSE